VAQPVNRLAIASLAVGFAAVLLFFLLAALN
jgi:hypothetical protein